MPCVGYTTSARWACAAHLLRTSSLPSLRLAGYAGAGVDLTTTSEGDNGMVTAMAMVMVMAGGTCSWPSHT